MIIDNSLFIALPNLVVFTCTALLCYFLTFVCIQVSYGLDLLDYPSGRKSHKKPMPFLGGLAIFAAFWAVVILGIWIAYIFGSNPPHVPYAHSIHRVVSVIFLTPKIVGIFLGSLVIVVTGLYDDKFKLSPLQKLFGQASAALILMSFGLMINLATVLGPLGYVATFFWILLIMNSFNFIDSLDGHCAGVALISCIIFFWITQIIDQPMVGLFLIAFSGALLGFLPHNFKPAKIFLGDNGSLLIGYMMAAFTLLCKYQTQNATYATLFIPVLIFGVPIYDTVSVVSVRLSRGIAPWEGDRNHFAHRLVKIGMSDKVAVIFSYFIAFTIGHVAILTTQVNAFGALIVGITFISIIGVIAFLEFYAAKSLRISEKWTVKKHPKKQTGGSA